MDTKILIIIFAVAVIVYFLFINKSNQTTSQQQQNQEGPQLSNPSLSDNRPNTFFSEEMYTAEQNRRTKNGLPSLPGVMCSMGSCQFNNPADYDKYFGKK